MSDGILHIDGFSWSLLKYSKLQLKVLDPEEREERLRLEEDTFDLYVTRMREWIRPRISPPHQLTKPINSATTRDSRPFCETRTGGSSAIVKTGYFLG